MGVLVEKSILERIEVSLFESHVHNSTKDLEKIFAEVLFNLISADEFDIEQLLFGLNLLSDLRWMNEQKLDHDIKNIHFPAKIGLEFDMLDDLLEFDVKVSQLSWILFLNLDK